MTISLGFYADSALTTLFQLGATLTKAFADDGSTGSIDVLVYLGSPESSFVFQLASAPGTGQIAVEIADSAGGSGQAASAIKLALSSGGLAGATGGAALNVGTQITSGVGNAIPIYLRITPSSLTFGTYTDLQLQTAGGANGIRQIAA